jgi:hypothetical protein
MAKILVIYCCMRDQIRIFLDQSGDPWHRPYVLNAALGVPL